VLPLEDKDDIVFDRLTITAFVGWDRQVLKVGYMKVSVDKNYLYGSTAIIQILSSLNALRHDTPRSFSEYIFFFYKNDKNLGKDKEKQEFCHDLVRIKTKTMCQNFQSRRSASFMSLEPFDPPVQQEEKSGWTGTLESGNTGPRERISFAIIGARKRGHVLELETGGSRSSVTRTQNACAHERHPQKKDKTTTSNRVETGVAKKTGATTKFADGDPRKNKRVETRWEAPVVRSISNDTHGY